MALSCNCYTALAQRLLLNFTNLFLCVDVEDGIGCIEREQHQLPYVTASVSQPVSSYGCLSRELVQSTQQQVDVLLLNVSSSETSGEQYRDGARRTSPSNSVHLNLQQAVSYGVLAVRFQ